MTDFELEILDGDRAGDIIPIASTKLSIGRRPKNDIVLKDEKCSGNHAEITAEGDTLVLRDLGSTNGTFLDGQKVDEIALGTGDVFRVGATQVRVRRVGAPAEPAPAAAPAASPSNDASMDTSDLSLGALDTDRLLARRKRSLTLPILFGVAAIAAAAIFVIDPFGEEAQKRRRRQGKNAPVEVAGNLLSDKAAQFEDDLEPVWDLRAESGLISFEFDSEAASGQQSLYAQIPADSDKTKGLAIARLEEPVTIQPGQPLTLVGQLQTSGGAQGMLRVRFEGDETFEPITTGSGPSQAGEFTQQSVTVLAPRTARTARLELVAWLPNRDAIAWFDDVGITKGGEGGGAELRAQNGRSLELIGTHLTISSGDIPLVYDLVPIAPSLFDGDASDTNWLDQLTALGIESPSDQGLEVDAALDASETMFDLTIQGGDYAFAVPSSAGLRFRTSSSGESFLTAESELDQASVTHLLVGAGESRIELGLGSPATVRGVESGDGYLVRVSGTEQVRIRTSFAEEARAARDLLSSVRDAQSTGEALDLLERVTTLYPHDPRALNEALAKSGELLQSVIDRVRAISAAANDAALFDAPIAYQRVLDDVADLRTDLGEERFDRREELTQLATRITAAQAARTLNERREHHERLGALVDALGDLPSGEALAAWVASYRKDIAPEEDR